MVPEKFNIANLVNNDGCFDLQFRKDTRHERTNSPTYYRWNLQFVVTLPKDQEKILEKVGRELGCGKVYVTKNQARLSVQNIQEIIDMVVPYFTQNPLSNNKKKDFELWKKAAHIVHKNKGKSSTKWEKNDLLQLLEIHKSCAKYKQKPRKQKWVDMAHAMAKTPNKNEA